MEIIVPGHNYVLEDLDMTKFGDWDKAEFHRVQEIQFVDRGHGNDKPGTTCQEVLRVLIDRVKFLENELHWDRNDDILFHLRKALLLFEIRALERKLDKGEFNPEDVLVNLDNGHFTLTMMEP